MYSPASSWVSSLMWKQHKDKRGAIAAIGLFVAYFFFYNSSSIMWWGGFTIGPRYLIPMLPFMVLPIIFAFSERPLSADARSPGRRICRKASGW